MENTTMKLSFIVPIYNVASYLRKCVDSLLAQDYEDYEIILVDDGSTDECAAICEEYVRTFETGDCKLEIKCIHQHNAGLSAARNAGIKIATGEYLCFVDSDDYWQPNVLGALMEQIERDRLDVLRFRLQYVDAEGSAFCPYKSDPFVGNDYSEEPTDGVTFLNTRMNTQCYAWTFIIKRSLIVDSPESKAKSSNRSFLNSFTPSLVTGTLFTPGIYFEDTDWTPRMLARAKRVASTNRVVYNYFVRQGSITNATNRAKQQKVLDDKVRLVGELQRQDTELAAQKMDNSWYGRMIADTVISIVGILSTDFYREREKYLAKLKAIGVYPLRSNKRKAQLISFSPRFAATALYFKNKISNNRFREFIRFCIVGAIAMGLHYAIYLFLLWTMGIDWSAAKGADWRATLAYTVGYAIALGVNMLLTARFTFHEQLNIKRGGGFLVSHAINYALEIGLLNLFLAMHVAEWLAPLLVLLVAVPINFVLVRFAFKRL